MISDKILIKVIFINLKFFIVIGIYKCIKGYCLVLFFFNMFFISIKWVDLFLNCYKYYL